MRTLVLVLLFALGACGGGGGGGGTAPQRTFVLWPGNANGTDVGDADDEVVRFFADTGTMQFRGVELLNARAATSGDLIWNGTQIGGVYAVLSTTNEQVAALVSLNLTLIDLYVENGAFLWRDSGIPPVFPLRLEPDPAADYVMQEGSPLLGVGVLLDVELPDDEPDPSPAQQWCALLGHE